MRFVRFVPWWRLNLIVLELFGSFPLELSICTFQALDLPDLLPRLRCRCLSALCRICGQGLLPRSLQIPICYNRSDTPLYRGGFADIWKGELQGRYVAVKVLRVYSTSDIGKITKVSWQSPTKIVSGFVRADRHRCFARRLSHGMLFAIQMCYLSGVLRPIKVNSQ